MKKYFEVKASYTKVDEISGKEKKAKETYLVDAMSFTEGEARINEELEQIVSGDFEVTNMATSSVSTVYYNENGDRFFKAKVTFINVDEASGKEKKTAEYMLVEANTVEDAYQFLTEKLSDMIVPFEIPAITESPIVEVFEYDLEEAALTMSKTEDLLENAHENLNKYTLLALSGKNKFSQVNDQAKIRVDIE